MSLQDLRDIYDPTRAAEQGYQATTELDLVLILDTTKSQDTYIDCTIACSENICHTLKHSGLLKEGDGLRLALLAFRDHDTNSGYLIQDFNGFTEDVDAIVRNVKSLKAFGGGDGPEAITTALDKALNLGWRDKAVKMAILMTDAPPHGIGEMSDSYEDGEPGNLDPLVIAKEMAAQQITLLIIACEPTLSNDYRFAHDFYMALAKITGGVMLPLVNIEMLAPLIVGFALEVVGVDSMASRFEELVQEGQRKGMSEEELIQGVFDVSQNNGYRIPTLMSTTVYSEPEDADRYVSIWFNANDTMSGRREHKTSKSRKIPRVPKQFEIPKFSNSRFRIQITLKNIWDQCISYSYYEDGRKIDGEILGNVINEEPTEFYVNSSYLFRLRSGSQVKNFSRIFTREGDWDLAQHFM